MLPAMQRLGGRIHFEGRDTTKAQGQEAAGGPDSHGGPGGGSKAQEQESPREPAQCSRSTELGSVQIILAAGRERLQAVRGAMQGD